MNSNATLPPAVRIGAFRLNEMANGDIWIQRAAGDAAGEGGQFDVRKLEAVIAQFYREQF